MAAGGFEFSVAVGRMHCACRDERREDRRMWRWREGGGGSVRCSEVGTELRRGESAATAAGRTVKICLLFVMELGYSWLT